MLQASMLDGLSLDVPRPDGNYAFWMRMKPCRATPRRSIAWRSTRASLPVEPTAWKHRKIICRPDPARRDAVAPRAPNVRGSIASGSAGDSRLERARARWIVVARSSGRKHANRTRGLYQHRLGRLDMAIVSSATDVHGSLRSAVRSIYRQDSSPAVIPGSSSPRYVPTNSAVACRAAGKFGSAWCCFGSA